eukprot:TRINITY_DN12594_c0_g1_i1.p1 TRINITY_DN12594_c0_g1~~TRINITY_DN12594_c0_g1_i1.p1  ORF type:complete len:377 (+),score=106.07 TRINITY_DN12594_c0_g1_i1:31-1161(+)
MTEPPTKKQKLDSSSTPRRTKTSLITVARSGKLTTVQELLEAGEDPNQVVQSNTALHFACKYNKLDVVNLLLDWNADPNILNLSKCTPLHWAIEAGNNDVISSLLQWNADPNIFGFEGLSSMHIAAKKGNLELLKQLFESGGELNTTEDNEVKNTVLLEAVFGKNLEVVKFLIDHSASIDCKNSKGFTPLHMAVISHATDIVEFLLSSEAHIDAPDNTKLTPLHWAVFYGFKDVVKVLLEGGADLFAKEKNGKTPIQFAKSHKSILKLLNKYGGEEAPPSAPVETATSKMIPSISSVKPSILPSIATTSKGNPSQPVERPSQPSNTVSKEPPLVSPQVNPTEEVQGGDEEGQGDGEQEGQGDEEPFEEPVEEIDVI